MAAYSVQPFTATTSSPRAIARKPRSFWALPQSPAGEAKSMRSTMSLSPRYAPTFQPKPHASPRLPRPMSASKQPSSSSAPPPGLVGLLMVPAGLPSPTHVLLARSAGSRAPAASSNGSGNLAGGPGCPAVCRPEVLVVASSAFAGATWSVAAAGLMSIVGVEGGPHWGRAEARRAPARAAMATATATRSVPTASIIAAI